jgi:hypothetical protein
MIAAAPRPAPFRDAARRIAPQLNAPLGSLEPLLRLWDAEGHQAQLASQRSAPQLAAAQRHSPHRGATLRTATLTLKGNHNDTD